MGRLHCLLTVISLLVCLGLGGMQTEKTAGADLVFLNGEIYTLNPEQPWATSLAVQGNRIVAVAADGEALQPLVGRGTRVIDLKGKFVTPGIIDGHVHFDAAGGLLLDANLMTVAGEEGLRREIRRVAGLLEEGEWITAGLWGAYEQWALADSGGTRSRARESWKPHRRMIDDLTPLHPCFLCRYDHAIWLANTAALRAAGLEAGGAEGLELDAAKKPTGIVLFPSAAFDRLRGAQKPKSEKRLLDENRAALKALAAAGIVEIHDIATPEQTARFVKLEQNGELTCRVWLRPDLSESEGLGREGWRQGFHPLLKKPDRFLRYGALKGYTDGIMGTHGALFFSPYDDQPDNRGHWRPHTSDDPQLRTGNMEKMYGLIRKGLAAGFVPNVHAIGDRGVAEMLDLYERIQKDLGSDLKGFAVIHAQVVRPQDFPRFKGLGVIAEVNPYHIADDMRWMEERIGRERCRGAYAFRSLLRNGATLCFGSDWPGTSAALYQMHPKYLIYAAVTRQTLKGEPAGGWFPEERITVEESLRAYTVNNARATLEGDDRGTLEPGKVADITVWDRNLLKIPPSGILNAEIIYTVVDGRVVFEKR